MNMFKSTKAQNREDYIDNLPDDRKKIIVFLDEFIQKTSPSLKPYFAFNMLGFGNFKYKNYKKEVIDWPTVALANQKNYISLYICSIEKGEYLAEKYKDKLGKVSVGKSCIRFKKLEDLNLEILKEIILKAEKSPGLQKLK